MSELHAPNVGPLVFGTSPLGSMPKTYGYEVGEERALATLDAILDSAAPVLDTSRNYGDGRSEELVGKALALRGGKPDNCIISTKLDRDMETNRFDEARARESLERSLTALGLDRVDVLHLHDPEYAADLDEVTRDGGAVDALFAMKAEGLASSVGLAMGNNELIRTLYERYPFDVVLTHNRYTLLNRSAADLYEGARAEGAAVWNAAPYAGGVLAKGADAVQRVTYQEATEEALAPVRAIEDLCASHEIPMGALALQFSQRDPLVSTTVIGVSKPERVAQTLEWAALEIPETVWDAVAELSFDTTDPEASRAYDPG